MRKFTDGAATAGPRVVRGADGVKRVVGTLSDAQLEARHPAQKPKRKPGRPPAEPGTAASVTVPLTVLRAFHEAAVAFRDAPRAADTARLMEDQLQWTTRKLGPAADPEYVPDQRRMVTKYRVTAADGTETIYADAEGAALAYGCTTASLSVMLTRGKGKCGRFTTDPVSGNPARIACEKVQVLAD